MTRIKLWTSASLSYAGRLQLLKSTIFSMQVYWLSIFIIPVSVSQKIREDHVSVLMEGSSDGDAWSESELG